jgi:hypothetical protein
MAVILPLQKPCRQGRDGRHESVASGAAFAIVVRTRRRIACGCGAQPAMYSSIVFGA